MHMKKSELQMKKSELLDGLREENRRWEALLAQIGPQRMDQSGKPISLVCWPHPQRL